MSLEMSMEHSGHGGQKPSVFAVASSAKIVLIAFSAIAGFYHRFPGTGLK